MSLATWFYIFVLFTGFTLYHRVSLSVWAISTFTILVLASKFSTGSIPALTGLWLLFCIGTLPVLVTTLRRSFLSKPLFAIFKKMVPSISDTERAALESGTVSWEAELFSGAPKWEKFEEMSLPRLTEEEQAFIDGPVNELCQLVNDWDVWHKDFDLNSDVWQFIKKQGFFGLIIPKEYGGKAFSAYAHSQILIKLASQSITASTTVSVPNSLGPGELILHYGTDAQKEYYLPRLAAGDEIPCFALTGPEAGSDAASLPDTGIVCKGHFEGEEVVGIKLNFSKRYITLAPIATVIALAFKLYDPDYLMGDKAEYGITMALVPTDLPGLSIGRRHLALSSPFQNGPIHGKDVFIPLDWIIGGAQMAGQGWQMLMECLAVGRAISLPASSVGGAKLASYTAGAYAHIRKQFNVSIANFEGVQEALAEIAGLTYLMDATRLFALSLIDKGEKPGLLSAITKYHVTQLGRDVINNTMDVFGGKAICVGPSNFIASHYMSAPIAITVEGANILTRNLIIFGQGAIRCHPYLLAEMESINCQNEEEGLRKFDTAFFSHIGYLLSNFVRCFVLGVTHGKLLIINKPGGVKKYYRAISRLSAAYAFLADVVMVSLGSKLKRKESMSARLGDVLSMLTMCSAVLKRFEEDGCPVADEPVVRWCCRYTLYEAQQAMLGVLRNMPNRFVAFGLKWWLFPLGRVYYKANDRLTAKVAGLITHATDTRERIASGIYLERHPCNLANQVDRAFHQVIANREIEKKFFDAIKAHDIPAGPYPDRVRAVLAKDLISREEADRLLASFELWSKVIAVDDFDPKEIGRGQTRSRPVKSAPVSTTASL